MKVLNIDNVPPEIIEICILYYKLEEIFDIISDNGINLSENKKIITKTDNDLDFENNSFGIIEIESESNCKCKWHYLALRLVLHQNKIQIEV